MTGPLLRGALDSEEGQEKLEKYKEKKGEKPKKAVWRAASALEGDAEKGGEE